MKSINSRILLTPLLPPNTVLLRILQFPNMCLSSYVKILFLGKRSYSSTTVLVDCSITSGSFVLGLVIVIGITKLRSNNTVGVSNMISHLAVYHGRTSRRTLNLLNNMQQTVRWNWQGFLTKHYDRATGKYKYDDWENILLGSSEPMKGSRSLLQTHLYNEEHVKPKEVKRRTAAKVIYNRQIKRVDDLTKYIKFMKDHPDEFDRGRKK